MTIQHYIFISKRRLKRILKKAFNIKWYQKADIYFANANLEIIGIDTVNAYGTVDKKDLPLILSKTKYGDYPWSASDILFVYRNDHEFNGIKLYKGVEILEPRK